MRYVVCVTEDRFSLGQSTLVPGDEEVKCGQKGEKERKTSRPVAERSREFLLGGSVLSFASSQPHYCPWWGTS